MKTYISDIIPRLSKFSKELANVTLLAEKHWVTLNPALAEKHMYIFRRNNELLISTDGHVEKGKWELISNDSLLLDVGDSSILFRHGFFDENILALKVDGRNEYAFFVTESKFNNGLNSIESVNNFLKEKYFENTSAEPQKLSREELEDNEKQIARTVITLVIIIAVSLLIGHLAFG